MAGLFALSINPQKYKGNFLKDLFWGTFYQQHFSEEYSGLATCSQGKIKTPKPKKGLFRAAFTKALEGLEGTEGIGYCGPTEEPFSQDSRLGKFSICFSGNLINHSELLERLKNLGHTFEREDDIEIIAKLLVQGKKIVDGIKKMEKEIQGSYSLLILTPEGIYASRSPDAHWPLVLGQKDGVVVAASESGGFSNLGFKLIRDLEPGEIILMKNGRFEIEDKIISERIQFCSFVWVYSSFPSGIFEGILTSLVRKRLGAALARRDIVNGFIPDIVTPIPDSGRMHALGYFEEFCRQINEGKIDRIPFYDELLLKYPYAGRSFTRRTEEARDLEADVKMLTNEGDYRNKEVAVVDDSIVRGTQIRKKLVPKLRRLRMRGIHLRIANPEILSHCPWGKTLQKGEALAVQMPSKEERIKFLGVETLEYNTVEDLLKAIGLPAEKLCLDCSLKSNL